MLAESKDDWIRDAAGADILQTAIARGAKLRRFGREWVGPCPSCGGTDRFAINPVKQVFLCRNASGGGVISMMQHLAHCSFTQACELITGRPQPGRMSSETLQERLEREKRAEAARRDRERREAESAAEDTLDRYKRRQAAAKVWRESYAISGTQAEVYLAGRGFDLSFCADADLRFHPELYNIDAKKRFPALVALVRDNFAQPIGVWRIWLGDGRKGRAPVEHPKKGLGDFRGFGGAVRLGGIAEEIGLCEGIETSRAVAELLHGSIPIWPALTAGGIASFKVPQGVNRVVIYEDSDLWKWNPETGKYTKPAGNAASKVLAERYAGTDVEIVIESPGINTKVDYVDVLRALKGLPHEA